MPIQILTPRALAEIALVIVLGLAGWYAYNWVYDRGASSVQVKWDKEKQSIAEQSAKVAADALATTKTLAATIEQQRSDTNAQISALNTSLGSAITGLRNRPARSSDGSVPVDPRTGAALGGTGGTLLAQDAEFLARESARADRLRLQLAQCQAAYQSARDALK